MSTKTKSSVPISKGRSTTYIFNANIEKEEDGRWSAWIEELPGCATWGYTRKEALDALKDAADLYVGDMIENGEDVPRNGVQVLEKPAVAVTV